MIRDIASRAVLAIAGLTVLASLAVPPGPAMAQTVEKAKVTAAAANTRSGPADYWYVTGQLKRGDVVTVVGRQRGWAEIIPPAGHYSLVLKSAIRPLGEVRDGAPVQGEVIGSAPAAVRAGEQGGRRLNKIQCYLTPGASSKVTIHRELGAYYQIAPPPGATVFVKLNLLDMGGGAVESTTTSNNTHNTNNNTTSATPSTTQRDVPVRVVRTPARSTTQPTAAGATMEGVRARVAADQEAIRVQLAKPLLDRDYGSLLKRFEETKADKAMQSIQGMDQYADAMITWVQQQIRLQNTAMAMSTTRPDLEQAIAEARQKVGVAGPPLYQATGILRRSDALGNSVAMPRLHKLESSDGRRVICYLAPAASDDWTSIVGKEVQVAGRREYRADWNFYLVHPEKLSVVGEGTTIISKDPAQDLPPVLLDPNNFMVKPEDNPETPAPKSDGETPKTGETVPAPADHPIAPLPSLRELPPATQPTQ